MEDNVLVSSSYHGITLSKSRNSIMRNNTVLDDNLAVNGANSQWIRINGRQVGTNYFPNIISNNLADTVVDTGFADVRRNIEIDLADYDRWFVDWRNGDFTLKPTAPVSGVGATLRQVGYIPTAGNGNGNGAGLSGASVSAFSASALPFQTGPQQLAVPLPLGGVLLLSGLAILVAKRPRGRSRNSLSR